MDLMDQIVISTTYRFFENGPGVDQAGPGRKRAKAWSLNVFGGVRKFLKGPVFEIQNRKGQCIEPRCQKRSLDQKLDGAR